MSPIATVQRLVVTTLTPLHIGAGGGELFDDLDYVSAERVHVIDHERLYASLSSERLRMAEEAAPLTLLLRGEEAASFARYSLPNPTGRARVPRLRPQLKDAFGRPYLPGSSLKGAIRTALAWELLRRREESLTARDLGANPRFADDPLLRQLMGRDPYHDLLRAMQVADSAPAPAEASLELLQVSLYSLRGRELRRKEGDWSFFVEALQRGVELRLSLRLDDYLLGPEVARQLDLEGGDAFLHRWLEHCGAFATKLIASELDFYDYYGPRELAAFYKELEAQARKLDPAREALMQIAWGAGWQGKTVGMALREDELAMVRRTFNLGRRGVDEFPKSRRLVERAGRAALPLGWVKLSRST